MDSFIEERYLDEIIRQADRALFCVSSINDSLKERSTEAIENLFREVEHFIQHASAISRFLWNPRKEEKKRCSYLKAKLKINDSSILKNRNLRDHLVHFDERLGKWETNSKRRIFVDQNIVYGDVQNLIAGVKQTDCIRNYNANNQTYTFCDQSFKLQDIVQEVKRIRESAQVRKASLANARSKK